MIGTNRPSREEVALYHYSLVGVLPLSLTFSAFSYCQKVLSILSKNPSKRTAIVGGTGLYLDALLRGLPIHRPLDKATRERLDAEYEKKGLENLLSKLSEADPEYYEEVDKKNPRRVIRALEVVYGLGIKFSTLREQRKKHLLRFLIFALFLPRKKLYQRIDRRVDEMIDRGLVKEVQTLLERGYPSDSPGLSTIGYKEIRHYLQGRLSLDQAILEIKQNTRHYAKRQITFMKKLPGVIHLALDGYGDAKEDAWIRSLDDLDKKRGIRYNEMDFFSQSKSFKWEHPDLDEVGKWIEEFYGA